MKIDGPNGPINERRTDMENRDNVLQFPHQGPDVREMMLDGKPETMLSERGVVLFYLSAWKMDSNARARNGLRLYCEYISAHGCKGGASRLLDELDGLDIEAAKAWVKRTFARYVQDQRAMVAYIIQT